MREAQLSGVKCLSKQNFEKETNCRTVGVDTTSYKRNGIREFSTQNKSRNLFGLKLLEDVVFRLVGRSCFTSVRLCSRR